MLSQANLPPGRYQMRVAAGNKAGKAGSVLYDLEVPDFTKEPFVMSGVALTSRSRRAGADGQAEGSAGRLPARARRRDARVRRRATLLVLFAEFYENVRSAAAHMLDFKAELRAEGGRVVQAVTDERSSTELQGKSGGYGFQARLPLDAVEPGLYVHPRRRTLARQSATPS